MVILSRDATTKKTKSHVQTNNEKREEKGKHRQGLPDRFHGFGTVFNILLKDYSI
jgi:hypothetical protein